MDIFKNDAARLRCQRSAWRSLYIFHAERFMRGLSRGDTFTGEDIRRFLEPRIGMPAHHNCWGGGAAKVIPDWEGRGLIRRVGWQPMTSPSANRRRTPVYQCTKPGRIAAALRKLAA